MPKMPDYYGAATIQRMIDEAGEDGAYCLWCEQTIEGPHTSGDCPKCGAECEVVTELGYWLDVARGRA